MKRPANLISSGIILLILPLFWITSCKKDDDWSNSPEAVLARNQFIHTLLTDTYYWAGEAEAINRKELYYSRKRDRPFHVL